MLKLASSTTARTILLIILALPALYCASAKKATSTTATQADFHTQSTLFSVKVNNRAMFTEHFKQVHYADFTVSGNDAIHVEVTFDGTIASAAVSPAILGIETAIDGQTISFTLPKRGWYVLTVNDDNKLFLFANAPDTAPKKRKSISVMDFVTDATGKTLQTAAIQQAIDAAANSGKTLVFPKGVYLTGTLRIGSHTDIYLADGAMIKGSDNPDDYPLDAGGRERGTNGEFMTFSRLIFVNNAENVRIHGRGIIDGSGLELRKKRRPANLIRIRNSRNVQIENVFLRDPAAWNTHILHSEDVAVRGVKMINDASVPNTDGFDPDASQRVEIDGCFAYCSDDNIAVKTTNNSGLLRELKEITVRNCVFLTRKSSLKVGTETKAERMSDILFENNDIVECDRAMALYCYDGATFDNIRFVNNRIERNYPDRQRMVLQFQIQERHGRGHIKNILIKDCSVSQLFPNGSQITGLDDSSTIDGITFDNVVVSGKRMTQLGDLGITKTPFVENIMIK